MFPLDGCHLLNCFLLQNTRSLTFDAGVFDLQEVLHLSTALGALQLLVGHLDLTCAAPGALPVHEARHVALAADVAVVLDAGAVMHAAVARLADQHHLVRRALRAERVPLAELLKHVCQERNKKQCSRQLQCEVPCR